MAAALLQADVAEFNAEIQGTREGMCIVRRTIYKDQVAVLKMTDSARLF